MVREKLNWKNLLCIMAAVILTVSPIGTLECFAADKTPEELVTVVDDGALLMEEEVDWLEEKAAELAEKTDWNVVVATCNDADGQTARTVCENYFDLYTTGDDGISCLVDMDNREIRISTFGEAILYLNDSRIDIILDESFEAVSSGDYAQCLYLMILRSGDMYDLGVPENAEIYDEDTGELTTYHRLTIHELLTVLVAAILAGVVVFFAIIGKYRLKWGLYEYDFHKSGSIRIDRQADRFINETVTHRHIQRSSGGGGSHHSSGGSRSHSRSTVHRTSSGRRSGGGGRKF